MSVNDLDRRIAELKGWEICVRAGNGPVFGGSINFKYLVVKKPEGETDYVLPRSTSISKAWELVEELGLSFRIEGGDGGEWSAVFDYFGQFHQESSPTAPVAICKAYIAAKEYLNQKGRR